MDKQKWINEFETYLDELDSSGELTNPSYSQRSWRVVKELVLSDFISFKELPFCDLLNDGSVCLHWDNKNVEAIFIIKPNDEGSQTNYYAKSKRYNRAIKGKIDNIEILSIL